MPLNPGDLPAGIMTVAEQMQQVNAMLSSNISFVVGAFCSMAFIFALTWRH